MTSATVAAHAVGFESPERLRRVLEDLHERGEHGWRRSPLGAALLHYAARRYAPLARRHGLDPWDAATAAFLAMRATATRTADDPWAVVTRAVQLSCLAEARANGLLCGPDRARRHPYDGVHDPQRFSDSDAALDEWHPALQVAAPDPFDSVADQIGDHAADRHVTKAIEDATTLYTLLGWPHSLTTSSLTMVTLRIGDAGSISAAFDSLTRDVRARTQLGVPVRTWHTLLRTSLGDRPTSDHPAPAAGVLVRLLIGEPLRSLLGDDALTRRIHTGTPGIASRGGFDA